MHHVIINGPNLNLLGRRQPEMYGSKSFEEFLPELRQQFPAIRLEYFQSNHEGALIDKLHEVGFSCHGVILNAGAYTHTSIALADAVSAIESPVVEVHITDISKRETYRQHSYLTAVCVHAIMGKGLAGYAEAIAYLTALRQ
ncbi:MAG: type II 3-dehydroquinate dehydratase [Chitinophagales bacterium]|nr:type II 3-dehydroquinate dehydratase [Chitinophagales bacterium]